MSAATVSQFFAVGLHHYLVVAAALVRARFRTAR